MKSDQPGRQLILNVQLFSEVVHPYADAPTPLPEMWDKG
jgi:hypothetical protein